MYTVDTCTEPGYFFSVNAWSWRGMYELGAFLVDSKLNVTRGKEMLSDAAEFKEDILRAADGSAIMDPNNSSKVVFLPSVVGRNQVSLSLCFSLSLSLSLSQRSVAPRRCLRR